MSTAEMFSAFLSAGFTEQGIREMAQERMDAWNSGEMVKGGVFPAMTLEGMIEVVLKDGFDVNTPRR